MNRSATALILGVVLASAGLAQNPPDAAEKRASIYYNFAMGRLYTELAGAEGNREDVNKAIHFYEEALKLDPSAGDVFEELTDLYVQSNRLADAEALAQDMLKQNPDNLGARRMLGRIYTRIALGTQGRVDESYLRKAVEQYQTITAKDPKDVESLVMLGKLQSGSNNSPEAEKAYNAALAIEPDNEEALRGLAALYAELGDNAKALEKLKSLADRNPNERTLALLAQQYEQMDDYKSAAEALKKAVELAPDDESLALALAGDLSSSGQYENALALYRQMAADNPRDWRYAFGMGRIYLAQHDYAKATEALDKAHSLDPSNLDVRNAQVDLLDAQDQTDQAIAAMKDILADTARHNSTPGDLRNRMIFLERLGLLYQKAEQYPQAIDAFQQIGRLDPNAGPRSAAFVIEVYRGAHDQANAQKEADAALRKYPKDNALVMEHAFVLADGGKVDEAAAEVRALLQNSPHDREVQISLAQVYEKGKRWSDMGAALDAAEKLSITPEEKSTIYYLRGAMLEREKKFEASEAEFRKVLDIEPDNASALNYLGYMLADRNIRLEEAYQLVKKAVDLAPNNGAYMDSLAWVYFRQGKLSDAQNLLERALIHMKDPTVHDHLGDVYAKLGKTREAIAQWQASLHEFHEGAGEDNDPDDVAKVNKKLDEAQAKLARESRK